MSKLYVYKMHPIDYWAGWMTETEYLESVKSQMDSNFYDELSQLATIRGLTGKAEYVAKQLNWEGDFAVGPLYSAIPGTNGNPESQMLIAWKQENDGDTFVAAPYPLSWLEGDAASVSG